MSENDAAASGIPAPPDQMPKHESLTFAEFSAANRLRCEDSHGFNHTLSSWSTSDWFVAIVGELGEAANIVKKLNRYRDGIRGNKQSEQELRAKLQNEVADVFIYLDLIAQACGFELGDAVADTFNAKSVEIGYQKHLEAQPAAPGAAVGSTLALEAQELASRIEAYFQKPNLWHDNKMEANALLRLVLARLRAGQ